MATERQSQRDCITQPRVASLRATLGLSDLVLSGRCSRTPSVSLPWRRVQEVYKRCSRGAHEPASCAPLEHLLYTSCTRRQGRETEGVREHRPERTRSLSPRVARRLATLG